MPAVRRPELIPGSRTRNFPLTSNPQATCSAGLRFVASTRRFFGSIEQTAEGPAKDAWPCATRVRVIVPFRRPSPRPPRPIRNAQHCPARRAPAYTERVPERAFMFVRMLLIGAGAAFLSSAATVSQITFNKDVLPVMQKRCQTCHRPGEVAPMSFLTYKDVRPWAKAIREA